MPDRDEGAIPYSGDRSLLPFLLGAAPIAAMGYSALRTMAQATPLQQVVGSTYAQWAAGMRSWAPNLGDINTALHAPILEAFKRRVGTSTALGSITTLEEAVSASQGFPALQSILKQSIGEFSTIKPESLGGSILSGMEAMGAKAVPLTTTRSRAVTHASLAEELGRRELGIARSQRANLRAHLRELAELTKDIMGTVPGEGTIPTFKMSLAGDRALSEMLVTVHRTSGPSVEMRIPLPSRTGEIRTAGGTRYYARKVLGDPERFMSTGVAEEMDVAEYSLRRLRALVAERQGAISQKEVNALQREIRKQMIFMGDKRGALATSQAGRTYAEQMVIPEVGITGNRITTTQRDKILERLGEMGRGVGMTPDALSKGVVLTQAGAKRLPDAVVTPQHWTQALTKGELAGGGRMNLFQVAPSSVELAAQQLGMETIMPRQDVIMMSNDLKSSMQAVTMRSIRIDPTMEASHRFNKIQQMLANNETTRQMLKGGATLEEAMTTFERLTRGSTLHHEFAKTLQVGEGEFLGFTASGPLFAKTYGSPTFIRDFTTVGDTTHVVLEGRYTPQKLFSRGGIKHTVEYANESAIKRLGIRAKALELLRMQGIDPAGLNPADPTDVIHLSRAEKQAAAMFGNAGGLVVEGKGWSAWEKISSGSMKNMSRFNQMVEAKWKTDFGRLPRGYWQTEDLMERRRIMATALKKKGISFADYFHPSRMALREELLQPGPAAEMLGIGRPGTFTDDAFKIFRAFGWTDITEDMAKRIQRDIPLQNLIEGAKTAAIGEGPAVPLADIMSRPGGLEALLEDAGARAKFIAEEGGMIELPHAYNVGGMKVSRIAVPEMGTGFTGYFTTDTGREMQRELDKQLRTTLTAATVDIGATGVSGEELVAQKEVSRYYKIIDRIARRTRDVEGGVVAGSQTFAIGREIMPDVLRDAHGNIIPQARIHPATFEKWVAQNLKAGHIDRSMVREYRTLFKEGRLPIKAIKHPARGPMSAGLFYLGATPKSKLGWQAERNFMYLSKSLLGPFVGDLDFDPLPADLFTSRGALAQATQALEGKTAAGELVAKEETVGYWLEQHKRIRKDVIGRELKAGGRGLSPWQRGKRNLQFMKERIFRDAASKTEVGIFTSRLGWPMGASMAESGMELGDWFKSSFWAEIMEEMTTLKARHDTTMVAGTAEELAAAFQSGRADVLKKKTREILGLKEGQEAYFDDVLDRLVETWKNMDPTRRQLYETRFASKGRASAGNFMRMAAAEVIEGVRSAGSKMTSSTGDVAARVFGKLGNAMRGNKKAMLVGLAATVGAGLLFSKPRDLTPEKVTSGQVAGGPSPSNLPPTMAKLQKGLYYKKGMRPGYRVNMTLTKGTDHAALANELSRIAGKQNINIHINDDRRQISRFDVERAMRQDRVLGAHTQSSSFYNSSRY